MRKLFYLLLASALLVLAACGGGTKNQSTGRTFTVALNDEITAVDPGLAWDYVTNQVSNQLTESIVTLDADSNVVPELAKNWYQADDLTYVYEIRNDVTFGDGSKMTMEDVLFSLERTRDPEGGTYFSDFYKDVESFTATGEWELTVKLTQPSAVFKYLPTTSAGRIISKAYYEKHIDNFGTPEGGVLGTGPYIFESWTSGQEIVVKKNKNYWRKDKLADNIIDTIVFKIIPDDTTRIIALLNNEIDFCVTLPLDMLDSVSDAPNLTYTNVDSYHIDYLGLNTQRPPFNDINVRRAVSHALNIPEIHNTTIKDAGTPGTILTFGRALYGENAAKWEQYIKDTPPYDYDLPKAKQYLARSAYPKGFTCTLVHGEDSIGTQQALFVQESLKALGITVEIIKVPGEQQNTYQIGNVLDSNGKRDYDMIIGAWEADYPDIDGNIETLYVSVQAGENGYNAAAYINPEVDALLDAQRATLDPSGRFEIQSRLMDIVTADVPYIVFVNSFRQSVLNKKYTGLEITPAWGWVLPIQNIRLAK